MKRTIADSMQRVRTALPTHVDGYRLERLVGRGGSGEVYFATRDERAVALKLLRHLSAADRARAEREALLAQRLDHPNLVRVFASGELDDGGFYLVMEWLDGETLADKLRRGPLSEADTVRVGRALAQALAHAHARNVVHRDLKPGNVIVCNDGRIKLLDLGIARALDETTLTTTGQFLGTPAYMSPEQVQGVRDIDAQSDLWALGVVLFECLTGQLPFEGDTPLATLFQIGVGTPRPLRTLSPSVSSHLAVLVDLCMTRERSERIASARAVEAWLAQVPAAQNDPAVAPTPHAETRLVSAVYLDRAADPRLLARLVGDAEVHSLLTQEGSLLVLGLSRWTGQEPLRAVTLARAVRRLAKRVAVVTAKVVAEPHTLPPGFLASVLASLPHEGLWIDPVTAALVREEVLLVASSAGGYALDPSGEAPPSSLTPFVGRASERAVLQAGLSRVEEGGRPVVVLLTGAPGMGRSRLLDEAVRALGDAPTTVTVLRAQGDRARQQTPFSALRDALRGGVDPLFAALFEPPTDADPQLVVDRVRADFLGLLDVLLGQCAIVWALDDVQWIDAWSMSLLTEALAPDSPRPMVAWLAAPTDAGDRLRESFPEATVLPLGPLTRAEATSLLLARGLPEGQLQEVLERAAGVPLLLESVDGETRLGSVPWTAESALRAQLDAMPEAPRTWVQRASIFGRTVWAEGVVALGGTEVSSALVRQGVVSARRESRLARCREYQFRVGWLAEVAAGLFPPETRRNLHAEAARWLSSQEGAEAEEIARHWEAAGEPDRALEAWVTAVERASRMGAPALVSELAARVLRTTASADAQWRVLIARDNALQLAGDRALQREGLDALEGLAPTRAEGDRAELLWRRVYAARMTGQAEAARRLVEVHASATAPAARRWRCALETEMALLEADAGRLAIARQHANHALELARDVGDAWLEARSWHASAYVLLEEGTSLNAGIEAYERAALGYQRAGDLRREAITLVNRGAAFAQLGRYGEALDCLDLAITLAAKVGNERSVAVSRENRGAIRRMLGELREAEDDLTAALHAARTLRHPRLEEATQIERLYAALAGSVDASERARRVEDVRQLLTQSLSEGVRASALAVLLRALPVAESALVAEARALVERVPLSSQIELRAALWMTDGASSTDRDALVAAVDALLAHSDDAEETHIRRRGLWRRWSLPVSLLPSPPASP